VPAWEAEGNMIENAAQYHLLGVTTTLILIYMYICTPRRLYRDPGAFTVGQTDN